MNLLTSQLTDDISNPILQYRSDPNLTLELTPNKPRDYFRGLLGAYSGIAFVRIEVRRRPIFHQTILQPVIPVPCVFRINMHTLLSRVYF